MNPLRRLMILRSCALILASDLARWRLAALQSVPRVFNCAMCREACIAIGIHVVHGEGPWDRVCEPCYQWLIGPTSPLPPHLRESL